jgi:hypothetical protein
MSQHMTARTADLLGVCTLAKQIEDAQRTLAIPLQALREAVLTLEGGEEALEQYSNAINTMVQDVDRGDR